MKKLLVIIVALSFLSCDREAKDKEQIEQLKGKAVDILISFQEVCRLK